MSVADLHREAPLTDLHAHPSLKAFLFNRNLWRHYKSGKSIDPLSSRSDFKMLAQGGVGVLWASHYLPERQLFKDCFAIKLATFILTNAWVKLSTKSYWDRLHQMMDDFEDEVNREPTRIEVAKSVADMDRIRRQGKIAIVHTVEGTHALEGDLTRLAELARRGVAMVTLNHFYRTGVGAQVDAIPGDSFLSKLCKFKFEHGKAPMLTQYGRDVLAALAANRMVVDVTHCWPDVRRQIYTEIGTSRPVVASHVGMKHLHDDPYNLADDEIVAIRDCDGLIGVILMPYWLTGHEGPGAKQVVDTMEHVATVAGSWDHVAIGSDFDGLTDPPDDIKDASKFGSITTELLRRGIPDADVRKVLGGNARRVLRAGWR